MIHGAFSYARQSGLNKKAQKVVGYGEISGSGREERYAYLYSTREDVFATCVENKKKQKTAKRT